MLLPRPVSKPTSGVTHHYPGTPSLQHGAAASAGCPWWTPGRASGGIAFHPGTAESIVNNSVSQMQGMLLPQAWRLQSLDHLLMLLPTC